MNTSLSNLVSQALPALSGSSITYNAERNMLMTQGYTSAAGNTYFQGIQLSERLAIVLDIGIGYAHTFLNGLKLYCFDGNQKKLISSQLFNCLFYSDYVVRSKATEMLIEYLESQAKMLGAYVQQSQLKMYAEQQVLAASTCENYLS